MATIVDVFNLLGAKKYKCKESFEQSMVVEPGSSNFIHHQDILVFLVDCTSVLPITWCADAN